MWLLNVKTVTPPESPPEPHPMTISDEVVAEAGQNRSVNLFAMSHRRESFQKTYAMLYWQWTRLPTIH